jgi:hypothetical protein
MKNQVPIAWRDYCAHLLIPLNRCRVDNLYMPWTCQEQKHAYEKCEYQESAQNETTRGDALCVLHRAYPVLTSICARFICSQLHVAQEEARVADERGAQRSEGAVIILLSLLSHPTSSHRVHLPSSLLRTLSHPPSRIARSLARSRRGRHTIVDDLRPTSMIYARQRRIYMLDIASSKTYIAHALASCDLIRRSLGSLRADFSHLRSESYAFQNVETESNWTCGFG